MMKKMLSLFFLALLTGFMPWINGMDTAAEDWIARCKYTPNFLSAIFASRPTISFNVLKNDQELLITELNNDVVIAKARCVEKQGNMIVSFIQGEKVNGVECAIRCGESGTGIINQITFGKSSQQGKRSEKVVSYGNSSLWFNDLHSFIALVYEQALKHEFPNEPEKQPIPSPDDGSKPTRFFRSNHTGRAVFIGLAAASIGAFVAYRWWMCRSYSKEKQVDFLQEIAQKLRVARRLSNDKIQEVINDFDTHASHLTLSIETKNEIRNIIARNGSGEYWQKADDLERFVRDVCMPEIELKYENAGFLPRIKQYIKR